MGDGVTSIESGVGVEELGWVDFGEDEAINSEGCGSGGDGDCGSGVDVDSDASGGYCGPEGCADDL